jgi:hypothetical protein
VFPGSAEGNVVSDAPAGLQNSFAVGVDYADPGVEPAPVEESGKPAKKSASFDPGEHTVVEVEEYLAKHPDETDAVLAAEKAGKARTTLVGD